MLQFNCIDDEKFLLTVGLISSKIDARDLKKFCFYTKNQTTHRLHTRVICGFNKYPFIGYRTADMHL